jgi:type IV secretory pathway VirB10-like protein
LIELDDADFEIEQSQATPAKMRTVPLPGIQPMPLSLGRDRISETRVIEKGRRRIAIEAGKMTEKTENDQNLSRRVTRSSKMSEMESRDENSDEDSSGNKDKSKEEGKDESEDKSKDKDKAQRRPTRESIPGRTPRLIRWLMQR